jgi:hypothetical protein
MTNNEVKQMLKETIIDFFKENRGRKFGLFTSQIMKENNIYADNLGILLFEALKECDFPDDIYQTIARKIVNRHFVKKNIIYLIENGLVRKNAIHMLFKQRNFKDYETFVFVLKHIEDGGNKKELIEKCKNAKWLLKLLKDGIIEDNTVGNKQEILRSSLRQFINNNPFPLKESFKQYRDIHFELSPRPQDIINSCINLKTNEKYSERENMNILMLSMLHKMDIVEIFSNPKRFQIMCDIQDFEMDNKDRTSILNKINTTHKRKFEQLLDIIDRTTNKQVFIDGCAVLANHSHPINFDIQQHKENIVKIINEKQFLSQEIKSRIISCVFDNLPLLDADKKYMINSWISNSKLCLIYEIKSFSGVIQIDMEQQKPNSPYLLYILSAIDKVSVINLKPTHKNFILGAIKYDLLDKIDNKDTVKKIVTDLLQDGTITQEQYEYIFIDVADKRKAIKVI